MEPNIYLVYILIGILVLFFLYIGFTLFFYRKKKIEWTFVIEQYKEALQDKPTLNIHDRITASQDLFTLIDVLIEYEIISDREYEILLQKKSRKIDIEDSVKRISTAVFAKIKPSVFTDVNNVVTEQCLMSYIQKRTFLEYFNYIRKNNEGEE